MMIIESIHKDNISSLIPLYQRLDYYNLVGVYYSVRWATLESLSFLRDGGQAVRVFTADFIEHEKSR